jgi:hypothetical protein
VKEKQKQIEHDKKILKIFVSIYCKKHHLENGVEIYKCNLCKDCYELLNYAYNKLSNCPLDPKPMCKKCHIHCYSKQNREKIKEIMKFSGIYLIKHGRLDLLFHYYF